MALTLTQCATSACQLLGVLASGEALSSGQLDDALIAANDMLDTWSSDQLIAGATVLPAQLTLVAGTLSYAVGAASPVAITPPPVKFLSAHYSYSAGVSPTKFDAPVELVDRVKWDSLRDVRSHQGTPTMYAFYDRGGPAVGTVYVAPIPVGTTPGVIDFTYFQALNPFPDKVTSITPRVGYSRLYRYGLAIALAPQYNVPVPDAVQKEYDSIVATLKGLNQGLYEQQSAPRQQAEMVPAP